MGIASTEKKQVMQDVPTPTDFLSGACPISEAVASMAHKAGAEERGAIFTKRVVVDFILDLVGYTTQAPLLSYKILEPSFGEGDFLFAIIDRLMDVAKKAKGGLRYEALAPALRAVELHHKSFATTKAKVILHLISKGVARDEAANIASAWLTQDDFLLTSIEGHFSHIVGNPPYVRQESIADVLMAEYRKRFATIYDRADLYVPFIERSLSLLEKNGKLSFICADRWMKNKYGSKLREYVSRDFSLTIFVDMFETAAFHGDVSAYPAITVFERSKGKNTRVFARPQIDAEVLRSLSSMLTAPSLPKGELVQEIEAVVSGSEPWVLESLEELSLVRRLEREYPSLEEAGCRVGIGVATGADRAFIGNFKELDVEPSRKLPLVMTKDIDGGHVAWRGKGVINPFGDDGKLVELDEFPRLKRYLELHHTQIAGRHIAEKNPRNWYRTIDRIYPDLTYREKLLIPDIKGDAHIVHETGSYYPHHNLYFVTSDDWDMRSLQMVLTSGMARLFVALYSTKMRGGYLRFQAQYLRRIRIPKWSDIGEEVRSEIIAASKSDDIKKRNDVVGELYKLSASERILIERKYVYVS